MTRRTTDSRQMAEMAFKAATNKPAQTAPRAPSLPGAKELVSLRIDRDVLDHFQEGGPGWQDRINDALRAAAGK
ncbi:MAG: BrnA antitoxin family protein [Deltaproteobacteria bacterium]|nr:BrnA antitoxin family protein [Deltaproteobacteria bacterium]